MIWLTHLIFGHPEDSLTSIDAWTSRCLCGATVDMSYSMFL